MQCSVLYSMCHSAVQCHVLYVQQFSEVSCPLHSVQCVPQGSVVSCALCATVQCSVMYSCLVIISNISPRLGRVYSPLPAVCHTVTRHTHSILFVSYMPKSLETPNTYLKPAHTIRHAFKTTKTLYNSLYLIFNYILLFEVYTVRLHSNAGKYSRWNTQKSWTAAWYNIIQEGSYLLYFCITVLCSYIIPNFTAGVLLVLGKKDPSLHLYCFTVNNSWVLGSR